MRTAYTVVIERETDPRVRWTPCVDPAICDGIAASASRNLFYGEITGYHPGAREALVYHWQLVPNLTGGFRPDSIRTLVVRLR